MPIKLHNHLIDKVAVIAGIFSGVALYPQVWGIVQGTYDGVALTTYVIIFCNSVVWLLYAVHRQLISLAIPSILNIIAAGVVLSVVPWTL